MLHSYSIGKRTVQRMTLTFMPEVSRRDWRSWSSRNEQLLLTDQDKQHLTGRLQAHLFQPQPTGMRPPCEDTIHTTHIHTHTSIVALGVKQWSILSLRSSWPILSEFQSWDVVLCEPQFHPKYRWTLIIVDFYWLLLIVCNICGAALFSFGAFFIVFN